MSTKLQFLINAFPKGSVITTKYLRNSGYSKPLINKYVKSGWLKSFGNGAYCFANDKIDWLGALSSIQNQLDFSFIPGGRTSIELQGRGHFARNDDFVFIYGNHYKYLPKWFVSRDWEDGKIKTIKSKLFPVGFNEGIINFKIRDFDVKISGLERALFELNYCIPELITFEEANYLYEGMLNLDPKLVQELLENCNYIKVKRLFLYFTDLKQLPCMNNISLNNVNLGTGKRVIAKNGKYNSKYKITVPENIDQEEETSGKYFDDDSDI